MKLALAHYSSSSDISGVTTWFERLILRLHNDGVKLYVHLHHFGDNPQSATILPALTKSGVSVEVVKRGRSLEADVRQTLDFLNRVQPTLFLPQCLNSHFFAAAIAGKQGLPWALTIHSDDPDYWAIANTRPPTEYGGKSVSVSEHIARMLAERGIDHDSAVIPYGVNVLAQTANYRSSPFRVVYSGRIVETQKRLSLVTAALIRSCQINPNIYVKIIGDGPSLASSRKAVTDSGLTSRVTFTGRLTPMQVERELIDAQAILLMSDFEGLPVALLEAMAVGVVPVVRNISSGIPELVHHEHTGLLVDGQPELAAQALSRLAHDPALWQSCSVAARQLVSERYSEDVCYQRWREFIDKLNSTSTVRYPLVIPDLSDLPVHDPRLGAGYPFPKVWYLKVASRLKRGVGDLGRILGQRS